MGGERSVEATKGDWVDQALLDSTKITNPGELGSARTKGPWLHSEDERIPGDQI